MTVFEGGDDDAWIRDDATTHRPSLPRRRQSNLTIDYPHEHAWITAFEVMTVFERGDDGRRGWL